MAEKVRRNRREQMLALCLARGLTVRDAAEEAGYGERQVFRKLTDDRFRSEVKRLQDQIVDRTCATLSAAGIEAVATLTAVMRESPSDAVRLSAAKSAIELGLRLREANDLLKRIRNLEEAADEAQRTN